MPPRPLQFRGLFSCAAQVEAQSRFRDIAEAYDATWQRGQEGGSSMEEWSPVNCKGDQ